MPTHYLCPKCGREGRVLPHSSSDQITYYRCDPCYYVWVHVHGVEDRPVLDFRKSREDFSNRTKKPH
jgi:rubredoxin